MNATEYKPYWQRLLDPRWQQKRLEILRRDNFTCHLCFEPDKTLHVHHFLYRKNAEPWEYPDHELVTLCEECHEEEEERRTELLSLLSRAEPESPIASLTDAVRDILERDKMGLWDWFHAARFPDLMHEAARRVRVHNEPEDYSI